MFHAAPSLKLQASLTAYSWWLCYIQRDLMLQILMDGPYQDNYVIIPDSSGIFVVDAFEPLFIDTGGAVYLAEDLITSVGQLVAGSIGRGFGKLFVAGIAPCCHYKIWPSSVADHAAKL